MKLQVLKNGDRIEVDQVDNVFCPTGQGGGVDPSCKRGGKSKRRGRTKSAGSEVEKVSSVEDFVSKVGVKAKVTFKSRQMDMRGPTGRNIEYSGKVTEKLPEGIFITGKAVQKLSNGKTSKSNLDRLFISKYDRKYTDFTIE